MFLLPMIFTPYSYACFQFFDAIVTQPMCDFLHGKETFCFMMVCGGMVRNLESAAELQQIAIRYVNHFFVQGSMFVESLEAIISITFSLSLFLA